MKKYFIILFLSNVYILAQTYVADYSYTVDRKEFHTFSRFPAKLLINKDVKLYTVDYGLNEKSSSQYVVSRLKHQYKQYSDSKTNIYIDDIIQDKQSFFVDKKPVMKWTLTKDVKINDKIKLKKATTSFRGETTPFGMMIKLKYPKVHGSFIMYLVLFTKLTMITKILVGNYYSSAKRMRLSKILSRILKLNLKITMSILN